MKEQATSPTPPKDSSRDQPRPAVPAILAVRKGCAIEGIGLSHYILMAPVKK